MTKGEVQKAQIKELKKTTHKNPTSFCLNKQKRS